MSLLLSRQTKKGKGRRSGSTTAHCQKSESLPYLPYGVKRYCPFDIATAASLSLISQQLREGGKRKLLNPPSLSSFFFYFYFWRPRVFSLPMRVWKKKKKKKESNVKERSWSCLGGGRFFMSMLFFLLSSHHLFLRKTRGPYPFSVCPWRPEEEGKLLLFSPAVRPTGPQSLGNKLTHPNSRHPFVRFPEGHFRRNKWCNFCRSLGER